MKEVSKILYHRFVEKEKRYPVFFEKFNLKKSDFDTNYKSISRAKGIFYNELIIKAFNLFESKINADKEIFKWNKKNSNKNAKQYCFSSYSKIDETGKSVKSFENFKAFYSDIKIQYAAQNKSLLQLHLPWIKDNPHIKPEECVCFYCGINEKVLSELYNDPKYTCKTKRNRGAWFELDRKDSRTEKNIYTKDNMVLCCYFCNNHKSDVISLEHMRHFFGESMFSFLIDRYEYLNKFKPNK
jgi:hypothetical protein